MPGAGHSCRLRRDLPLVPPRLLWLLRADGNAQHRGAGARMDRHSARRARDIQRAFRTFNAIAEPFLKESAAHGD